MIGTAPKSSITGVPGWETEDEQAVLLQLAQNVPEKGRIVEIGAEFGMSASIFCKGAHPSVEIVSIDLFPSDMLQYHRKNLELAGFKGRSRQVQGDSALAGKVWKGGDIDLLFVDGDHTYEGCKADIDSWSKFVKVGGFMAFHDVANVMNRQPHYIHFSVTQAVSEWFFGTAGKWRQVIAVNTLVVFERLS